MVPEPADKAPAAAPEPPIVLEYLNAIRPVGWQLFEVARFVFQINEIAQYSHIDADDLMNEADSGFEYMSDLAPSDMVDTLGLSWIPETRPEGQQDLQRVCISRSAR